MKQTIQWKKTQPGSTEAVQFSNGMLVTAEDLTAAMHYPLSVIQVLLRAYFGCGIVCGLALKNPAQRQAAETSNGQRGTTGEVSNPVPAECDPNFILTVERGVALGCDGYPIEVCGPIKLDLTPDPCRPDPEVAKEMFIALRRVTAAEATARPCGCGSGGGEPAQQCSRMRDHALVQAFDEEHKPAGLCETAAPKDGADGGQPSSGAPPTAAAALCDCLTQCGECSCCGESWVLLGSVMVSDKGLGTIDPTGRRLVKPIACHCPASKSAEAVAAETRVTETPVATAEAVVATERAATPAA